MKRTFFTHLLLCSVLVSAPAMAQDYLQDPKYGSNEAERAETLTTIQFFNDAYNAGQYDVALVHMKKALSKAPAASLSVYANGGNIYKQKIAGATSLDERNKYVDTLMVLYDQRLEYFDDINTRVRKATEYQQFRPDDTQNIIKNFEDVFAAAGDSVDPVVVNIYYQVLVNAYKTGQVDADRILAEYDRFLPFFETNPTPEKEAGKSTFEALFVSSGVADEDNLEKVYGPQIAANPDDVDLLEKVVTLLSRLGSTNDFYVKTAEALYAKKPSSQIALGLAAIFEEKQEFQRSRTYLNEQIAIETDPVLKSNLAVRIASGELAQRNFSSAANYARQSLEINPENGLAYRILGSAYANGSSNCSDIEQSAVFWLAVDNLTRARDLLRGDADQISKIDQEIASYRRYFPSSDMVFFNNLTVGASYTVNCGWVSGRTTVRAR